MRLKPVIMIVLALVFGGSAVVAGNSWLERQAEQQGRNRPVVAVAEAPPMATIVVAANPLRYGEELTARSMRQIPWPADALPAGAFATVDDLLKGEGRRIVLAPMEANEPVLQPKITGAGQRATLSALIDDDKGAVTIPVDEVAGLAGLVLPGDRVDVFATQTKTETRGQEIVFNDRILQNVRVLAVGQLADERTDKAMVVRAVTIEVDQIGAQKVAIASRSATLSLMLRKAGETASRPARRIAMDEIGEGGSPSNTNDGAVNVGVSRGLQRTTYAVPKTGADVISDKLPLTAAGPRPAAKRVEAAAQPVPSTARQ